MKITEATAILGQAAIVFPSVTLSEPAFRAWHKLFENEDAQKFQAALTALVKEAGRVFFPTPGEVTAMLLKLGAPLEPSPDELWALACSCASAGLSIEAAEDHMRIQSKRAARALRSVGWERIRYADFERELPFVRRDFIEALKSSERFEDEQTTRMEALSCLQKLQRNISGSDGARLGGLQNMVGGLPAPTAKRGDGALHKDATAERRALPEN